MPDNLESVFYGTNTISNIYTSDSFADYFRPDTEKLHQDAGMSIMLVMNQNFVIAIDLGKALNAQDGNIGFSIGLNYLF
jgi:hypothetical protein